ncbi:MAG: DUF4276 family protein, partial [Alphaproteobacteria bacterium]|nr:DUF4276 family protein [Alphaproteobacteria bacterium]
QDLSNCRELKSRIKKLVPQECQNKTIIRIVCRELESWYLGDFDALKAAYGEKLETYRNQSRYRTPDQINDPYESLKKLIPNYQKIEGSKKIAPMLNHAENNSTSFNQFIRTIEQLSQ